MKKGAEVAGAEKEATFLLTDVEGSTALWERFPSEMNRLISALDELLESAVQRNDGRLVKSKGEGDSSFSVFEDPASAVAAAVEMQRRVPKLAADAGISLKVRIGLHHGPAYERGNDFFGETVNRVARLRAAAHGGQILFSETLWEMVRDRVGSEISVRDLGLRRLKDLTRPERILQLTHPDLTESFPPIAALDARPNNLPVEPTEFVGRRKELDEIKGLIRGTARLVTITGPPGVGKTRVAFQSAADLIDEFDHGVWIVPLAEAQDPSLVISVMQSKLGVKAVPGASPFDAVVAHLQDNKTLIVLDNFEHVLEAGPLVADLLARCPNLKVLTTSRRRLNLRAEREFKLEPLPVPSLARTEATEALTFDSVVLFTMRAESVNPGFRLEQINLAALIDLCTRLEGIPLAIELAAAQLRQRNLEEIVSALDTMLDILVEGPVDLPPRQRALGAAIAWSYDLLDENQKQILEKLAVFAGTFTPAMSERLTGASRSDLESLLDHNLLRPEDPELGRVRMLDSVREFCIGRLDVRGDLEATRRDHLQLVDELAGEIALGVGGPQPATWISTFLLELPNIRAAITWGLDHGRETVAHTLAALYRLWPSAGIAAEGQKWAEMFLDSASESSPGAVAAVSQAAGWMALTVGNPALAKSHFERALEQNLGDADLYLRPPALIGLGHARLSMGDIPGGKAAVEQALDESAGVEVEKRILTMAHNVLGVVASMTSNFEEARLNWEKTAALAEETGDLAAKGSAVLNLATVAASQGNVELAYRHYSEALELQRTTGNRAFIPQALTGKGQSATEKGDLDEGRELLEEAVSLRREIGEPQGISFSVAALAQTEARAGRFQVAHDLAREAMELAETIGSHQVLASVQQTVGEVLVRKGDFDEAFELLTKALTFWRSIESSRDVAICLDLVAACKLGMGEPELAARLLGAASSLGDKAGFHRTPGDEGLIAKVEGELRQHLSDSAIKRLTTEGGNLDMTAAINHALGESTS